MNPFYCPTCGKYRMWRTQGSDPKIHFCGCVCGTEWKTRMQGSREITEAVYPATNLDSD